MACHLAKVYPHVCNLFLFHCTLSVLNKPWTSARQARWPVQSRLAQWHPRGKTGPSASALDPISTGQDLPLWPTRTAPACLQPVFPLLRPTTLAELATCRNISGPILLGLNETPRFPAVWCLSPCWGLNWDLNLCLFSKGLKFYAVFPGRLNTSCKIWSPNAEEVLFLDTVKTDPFFFRDRAVDPEHVKSLMWSNKPHPRLSVC